jgi:radical SAM modification target selenobiotic family peptide
LLFYLPYNANQAKDVMFLKEDGMDKDTLKKLLAGLCIATLVAGCAVTSGCAKKDSSS